MSGANKANDNQLTVRGGSGKQSKKQVADNEEQEEEEEAANQLLSSSSSTSSTSSSSGLSSMNSSSLNGKGKYQTTSDSCNHQRKCHHEVDTKHRICHEENEVKTCLRQLIYSVADQAESELNEYTSLHEAVPAKTRSTTTTSGSSDEDVELSAANKRVRQLLQAETPTLAEAHLVCRIGFNSPRENILQMVRNYLATISISERDEMIVISKPKEGLIEWRNKTAKGQQQVVESVLLAQTSDCLIEGNLVVWILSRRRETNKIENNEGALIDVDGELETTLDDIALALDEPVDNHHHPDQESQVGASDDAISSPVEVLACLCSSEEEAGRLKQVSNSNFGTRKHEFDGDELEVLLNKVAIKKKVADCSQKDYSADKIGDFSDAADDDARHVHVQRQQQQQSNQHPHDWGRLNGSSSLGISDDPVSGNMNRQQLATSGGRLGSKRNQQMMVNLMVESKATISATRIDQTKSLRLKGVKVVDQRICSSIAKSSHEAAISNKVAKQVDAAKTPASSTLTSVAATVAGSSLMTPTNNDRKVKTKSLSQEIGEPLANGKQVKSSQAHQPLGGRSKVSVQRANDDDAPSTTSKLKKSASGLDLSTPPAPGNVGLASYYRNMANKVISNGQSRIKSFRDEMIKLNNRLPSSASSSSITSISPSSSASASSSSSPITKRTTANSTSAGQQRQSDRSPGRQVTGKQHQQPNNRCLSSASSERNLSFLNEFVVAGSDDNHKSSNGREKAKLNGVLIPVGEQQGHQHGFSDNNLATNDQAPIVKPRTSILKNKQQQNNSCDINNNNKSEYSNRKQQTSNNQRQVVGGATRAQEHYRSKCDNVAASSQSITKPKSILKTSKSVSNIASSSLNDGRQQILSYKSSYVMNGDEDFEDDEHEIFSASTDLLNSSVSLGERRREKEVSQLSLNQSEAKHSMNNNDYQAQQQQSSVYRLQRRSLAGDNKVLDGQCDTRLRGNLDKRRSTYSMANERFEADNEIRREGVAAGKIRLAAKDEPASFERMKQRASCYDISRLMSRNGLQNQLSKLRSGSTNSITGKPRQCRPALLLNDSKEEEDDSSFVNVGDDDNDDEMVKQQVMNSNKRTMSGVKTTSSGADGTVRAKVSAAQLNSNNMSHQQPGAPDEVNWSSSRDYSAPSQGGRRQQQQQQQQQSVRLSIVKGTKSAEDATSSTAGRSTKKSEFDPRSLRRVPGSATHHDTYKHTIVGGENKPNSGRQATNTRQINDGREDLPGEALSNESSAVAEQAKVDQSAAEEDQEVDSSAEEDESPNQVSSSSLSKRGPFNLLRQSFNQKTLSSMLRFSGRASLRMKSSSSGPTVAPEGGNDSGFSAAANKKSAIAIAEANLLAAKQLKQQAQKLKEQQKREQQQALMDPTTMMLRAVQYNQQLQRQQQQQMLYQQAAQQYAVAARGHMFDATSVQMQHQLLIQRQQQQHQQQQQQLAYMANLSSAHYMAQQMAVLSPAMVPMPAALPAQQLMYVQPAAVQQPQQSSGIFRKSILKRSGKTEPVNQATKQQLIYQSQVTANQQLVPMAVNHHSSFNIVYSGHSSTSSQIPQIQQATYEEPQLNRSATLSKQSSLGASMRKTVRSILINRSSLLSSSTNNPETNTHLEDGKQKLKSALKSSSASNREIHLNSEGSDGDSSSSDSTTINSHKPQVVTLPKSALKKTSLDHPEISSASSDSSCSSGSTLEYHEQINERKSPLTRGSDYHRQSLGRANQCHAGKQPGSTSRKNVTFSTKLTSIL